MNKRKISLSGLGPRRNKSGAAFVKLNEADDRRTTQLQRIAEGKCRKKSILSFNCSVSFFSFHPLCDLCVDFRIAQ